MVRFCKKPIYFCLIICSIFLWKCNTQNQIADIILLHGKTITMDPDFSIQEAIAIKDGIILAVGSDEEIEKYAYPETKVIDLNGRAVIPGINEGHMHPIPASQSEYEHSIPDIHKIPELLHWIYNEAKERTPGEWIIFPKFFATRMIEMRQPTKAELDSVAPENPVFLDGSYGGMINSRAMQISGISTKSKHSGLMKKRN